MELILKTERTEEPIAGAWIYLKRGAITLLRTDDAGLAHQVTAGKDATWPWEYADPADVSAGEAELLYSTGARPIPDAALAEHPEAFVKRDLEPTVSAPKSSLVPSNNLTPLTALGQAVVRLPKIVLGVTLPSELSLWPLLWTNLDRTVTDPPRKLDVYYSDQLLQGAAAWGHAPHAHHQTEFGPPPAAGDPARPRPRGLRVKGWVDSAATALRLKLYKGNQRLVLRAGPALDAADADEVRVDLGHVAGDPKTFEAAVYLKDPSAAFGPIVILLVTEGTTPIEIGGFACHLFGLQAGLVKDTVADGHPDVAGEPAVEDDEKIIFDFTSSPFFAATQQDASDAIDRQTRVRRMVTHDIEHRLRPYSTRTVTPVTTGEMPHWMAELQLIGVKRAELEDLLLRRKHRLPGNPTRLMLSSHFTLHLEWHGPDWKDPTPHQPYDPADPADPSHYDLRFSSYQLQVTGLQLAAGARDVDQGVVLQIDDDAHLRVGDGGVLLRVGDDGAPVGALDPAPVALPFPDAQRRTPRAALRQRRWGRRPADPLRDAVVIEWQPAVQALRGGDAQLELDRVFIDSVPVDPGLIVGGDHHPVPPPATDPLARPPQVRVRGHNPAAADVMSLVDVAIDDFMAEHGHDPGRPWLAIIPVEVLRSTMRRLVLHESDEQALQYLPYERSTAGRFRQLRAGRFREDGWEAGMPFFGYPHGYGAGQQDSPVSFDDSWSVVGNIKTCVDQWLRKNGATAWRNLGGAAHIHANDPKQRAVLHREMVKAYNGGRECHWDGHDWFLRPDNSIEYCNQVLQTHVHYLTHAEPDPAHPGHNKTVYDDTPFDPAMFPAGI